jgi:hypothetical protein
MQVISPLIPRPIRLRSSSVGSWGSDGGPATYFAEPLNFQQ